jgi:hypothetical protein
MLSRSFVTRVTPIEDVRAVLWNESCRASDTQEQSVVLEQYKIYVEMADRISARRGLTNTFFLTINTAIFAGIGVVLKDPGKIAAEYLVFPTVALLIQCVAWYLLVRSYRQLNSAKYTVVGALEERLPASPYWKAEWSGLGKAREEGKYFPLSYVEQWIPFLFAMTYIASLIVVVAS